MLTRARAAVAQETTRTSGEHVRARTQACAHNMPVVKQAVMSARQPNAVNSSDHSIETGGKFERAHQQNGMKEHALSRKKPCVFLGDGRSSTSKEGASTGETHK